MMLNHVHPSLNANLLPSSIRVCIILPLLLLIQLAHMIENSLYARPGAGYTIVCITHMLFQHSYILVEDLEVKYISK